MLPVTGHPLTACTAANWYRYHRSAMSGTTPPLCNGTKCPLQRYHQSDILSYSLISLKYNILRLTAQFIGITVPSKIIHFY